MGTLPTLLVANEDSWDDEVHHTQMIVGVPRERGAHELRVAIDPKSVLVLQKLGLEVLVEENAGLLAGFSDDDYRAAGADIVSETGDFLERSQLILGVWPIPMLLEHSRSLRAGQVAIGFLDPLNEPKECAQLAESGLSLIGMELIPRITRAQGMDALSSMATIAGYKAVLIAAVQSPRLFPMLMTAAGTIAPARVFVIGAGVAGLQAIATAKRLGAIVEAYDVRPTAREQVESVGGKFVQLDLDADGTEDAQGYAKQLGEEFYRRQRELMAEVVARSNIVITTAAIPGKQAPLLVTTEMLETMPAGSVIIDLAAARGGNCEASVADETVVVDEVTVMGPTNLPATVPQHASEMYARNLTNLVGLAVKKDVEGFDFSDEVIAESLVTHQGDVVHPVVRSLLGMGELAATSGGES
ncbi:NAD(P) transhydrogenase subunit alpha part 1 [Planctomycetes bacterium Pan216]|uniref:NAD(P) transhydrogenase subunit alpha part 1 n=1 Tax=Kolteria novifilia TaxID=2527975 RepID=A0A518B5P3_9BACT|nr:NAD(P) transhydrogenase subunit alpha part 1 [Planctomycetes bacterium Pan216]